MNSDKLMIDSATGASPPRFRTKDMGCSPIRFRPSIESITTTTTTLENMFEHPSDLLDHQQTNSRGKIPMKKYILSLFIET